MSKYSNCATSVKKFFLDVLFPVTCLSCGRESVWFCENCLKNVKLAQNLVCPSCESEITPRGSLCPTCRRTKEICLDALVTAASYENRFVKQLVHNFKYRFVTESAKPLAELMTKAIVSHDLPLPHFLVPVPLHARRLRWRGFNQSELLARELSRNLAPPLAVPVLNILERRKNNKPQMEIKSYRERLENMENIFILRAGGARAVRNKKILLIDDIATTGATLEECAKVLKANGARKVTAAVVARQTLKK